MEGGGGMGVMECIICMHGIVDEQILLVNTYFYSKVMQ